MQGEKGALMSSIQGIALNICVFDSFNSLMATNAARYRMVAGKHIKLLEFGLRRAQGPDGGLSASKYSYIGKSFYFHKSLTSISCN